MDTERFDQVAKTLAHAGTRRRALGGLLAGALGLLGTQTKLAAAKKTNEKRVKICLCGPAGCQTKTVKKADRGNVIRRHAPCASRGTCTGVNPCSTQPAGCTPNCDRKVCGDDGCGGRCGTCDPDQVCADGRCASSCPGGQKVCDGECIPSNQCCTTSDCPAATPDCCGGACIDCSGGRTCIGGTCQATCAAYGASACETPTTTCDENIVTCGGNPNCWALPTTSGCCACAAGPARLHRTCTTNRDCLGAATCDLFSDPRGGHCRGDQDLPCRTDADCASLLLCRQGACGGQICTTDADCEDVLGPGTVCISGAAHPCSAGGANVCWTLCTGA